MTVLEMVFQEYLRVDVRFVDDKAGLWKVMQSTTSRKHRSCKDYTNFLQKLCGLDWERSELKDNMVFLDLHVWIDRASKLPQWKSFTKP